MFDEIGLPPTEPVVYRLSGQVSVSYDCLVAGNPAPLGMPETETTTPYVNLSITADPGGEAKETLILRLPAATKLACPSGAIAAAFEGKYTHMRLEDTTNHVVGRLPDYAFIV